MQTDDDFDVYDELRFDYYYVSDLGWDDPFAFTDDSDTSDPGCDSPMEDDFLDILDAAYTLLRSDVSVESVAEIKRILDIEYLESEAIWLMDADWYPASEDNDECAVAGNATATPAQQLSRQRRRQSVVAAKNKRATSGDRGWLDDTEAPPNWPAEWLDYLEEMESYCANQHRRWY